MIFERDTAREWLEIVYGTCQEKIHICSTLNWRGNTFSGEDIDAALDYIQDLHDNGAEGIYARVTTLSHLPVDEDGRQRSRGSEADSRELAGMWADIDIAGPGHKTTKVLPATIQDAELIIAESGLPEPSVWVHSGGGVYPWWLLRNSYKIDGEEGLDQAKIMVQGWQKLIAHSAAKLGFHYGTEVADLARVLRIPGTVNRKAGLERPCAILEWGSRTYDLGELEMALVDGLEKIPEPEPATAHFDMAQPIYYGDNDRPIRYANGDTNVRPGDDFNIRAEWRSILLPHGWEWVFQRGNTWHLRRPGKREGTSATIGHSTDGYERLYVFTSSTEFEPNVPYTKFAAYTLLEYGGDYAAAGRALRAQGFGSGTFTSSTFTQAAPPASGSGLSPANAKLVSALESQAVDGQAVSVETLPSPKDPTAVMDVLGRKLDNTDKVPHLRYWRDTWYRWSGTNWRESSATSVRNWLYTQTERAVCFNAKGEPMPWAPDRAKISNLLDVMSMLTVYRPDEEEPFRAIACQNGVLDLDKRELGGHHPRLFNLYSLPFDYDPTADCPTWKNFLDEVLPEDEEAQAFLQEWFGYVISGRTDLQKMASLVGPKRCGKGTIARVLIKLLGQEVTASPTLGQMSSNFGEEDLLGKSLAIMSDARWDEPRVSSAVAALLAIVGEDSRTVARKNRTSWNGKLDARFMVMSNDSPKFADASGALAGRMIHIQFHTSFYGREDTTLSDRLFLELSGILNWALEGLDRLNKRGRFVPPTSGLGVDDEVRETSNPVYVFAQDYLEPGEQEDEVDLADLYSHYQRVCEREGRHAPALNTFSRMLSSALADQKISIYRKRVGDGERRRFVRRVKVQQWVPKPAGWLIGSGGALPYVDPESTGYST
jgi:putative DNA primase/helicase